MDPEHASRERRKLLFLDDGYVICDGCDEAKLCEDDGFGNRFCDDCREENEE